ncbi:MAG TPA: hypothetical protein VNS29_03080 [Burkholderiaceae bacterium]|nr:hypothetical protein [Burkholderiaceae bacterium]
MSYGKWVGSLPLPLKRHIIAYDNLPDHGGCKLYLRGGPRRIVLELCALDHDRTELAELLCELADHPTPGPIRITVEEGRLAVKSGSDDRRGLEPEPDAASLA